MPVSCAPLPRASSSALQGAADTGVEPNVLTYSAAVAACEKAGQGEWAVALLRGMARGGVEPNEARAADMLDPPHRRGEER